MVNKERNLDSQEKYAVWASFSCWNFYGNNFFLTNTTQEGRTLHTVGKSWESWKDLSTQQKKAKDF